MIAWRSRRGDEPEAPQLGRPGSHTDIAFEPISVRIRTAAQLTGISRSRIYELIESGDIETVKIGRSTFILFRSLRRLMEGE